MWTSGYGYSVFLPLMSDPSRLRIPTEVTRHIKKPFQMATIPLPPSTMGNTYIVSAMSTGPRTPRMSLLMYMASSTYPSQTPRQTRWKQRVNDSPYSSAGNLTYQAHSTSIIWTPGPGQGRAILYCCSWTNAPEHRRKHKQQGQVVEYISNDCLSGRRYLPSLVVEAILWGRKERCWAFFNVESVADN
jgi:hypothetical protein